MMKRIIILSVILIVMVTTAVGCSQTAPSISPSPTNIITVPFVGTVKAEDGYDFIQKSRNNSNFALLDVRTPEEYNSGYISGAINIDFYSPDFQAKLSQLDKSREYLVYCRTGNRSAQAVKIMHDMGFKWPINLEGGITSWTAAGYPVEQPAK